MPLPQIDPQEFVASVSPILEAQDPAALLKLLETRWSCEQITGLLLADCCDVRKVAALALALIGGQRCLKALSAQLKDPDPMVNQMCEHALWSIWFRLGTPDANHQLCRGMRALNRGDHEHALSHFDRAIELDPKFAEAYNQRAIVKYLQERYDESLEELPEDGRADVMSFWRLVGHGPLLRSPRATEESDRILRKSPLD